MPEPRALCALAPVWLHESCVTPHFPDLDVKLSVDLLPPPRVTSDSPYLPASASITLWQVRGDWAYHWT